MSGEEQPDSAKRMELEEQVGWTVCGINGCILSDRHPGQCIFQTLEEPRRRRATESRLPDYNAPQLAHDPKRKQKEQPAKPQPPPKSSKKGGGSKKAAAPKKKSGGVARPVHNDDDVDEDDGEACEGCGKTSDGANMLLCDGPGPDGNGCEVACHLYCCVPPLKSMPDGDWLCPKCAPVPASSKANGTDAGAGSKAKKPAAAAAESSAARDDGNKGGSNDSKPKKAPLIRVVPEESSDEEDEAAKATSRADSTNLLLKPNKGGKRAKAAPKSPETAAKATEERKAAHGRSRRRQHRRRRRHRPLRRTMRARWSWMR